MATSFRGSGDIGVPPNVKEGGKRVDFKAINTDNATNFDFLIETKCPRFAWARATLCPCAGFSTQTDQPDPDCTLCNAVGFHYFKPHEYVADKKLIGELDDTQCALADNANAVVIKALLVNAASQPDIFSVLGSFSLGSATCTVRRGNRLGYYDRLIWLDDEMVYSEVLEVEGTGTTNLRYPGVALNLVRSIDTVYDDTELELVAGNICWRTGLEPTTGTRIAVHYICRPVWTVLDHTKLNRTTLVKQKKSKTDTPAGDVVQLPPQVLVRLEHLPMNPSD